MLAKKLEIPIPLLDEEQLAAILPPPALHPEGIPSQPAIFLDFLEDTGAFSRKINFTAVHKEVGTRIEPNYERHRFALDSLTMPFEVDRVRRVARYVLPRSLLQFEETITKIAVHRHATTIDIDGVREKGVGRLSVEQSTVAKGAQQRANTAFHRDGEGENYWINGYMYVVADTHPTEFWASNERYPSNWAGVKPQADDPGLQHAEAYQIAYAPGNAFHHSPVMSEHGTRTFLRMSYETFHPYGSTPTV